MKTVHLHEVSDDRIIVEMKGTPEDLIEAFDRFIASGVRLYHPKAPEDRYTEALLEYPEKDLELVNLKARRNQVKALKNFGPSGQLMGMSYIAKSADDALFVKMGM